MFCLFVLILNYLFVLKECLDDEKSKTTSCVQTNFILYKSTTCVGTKIVEFG